MNIYWVSHTGAEQRPLSQLQELLQQEGGFAWLDIPVCDDQAASLLLNTFGFHTLAVQACRQRSYLPKVHAYANHLFVALQVPEGNDNGHVQLFELDQFVGKKYLVTVHEPPEDAASADATMRETRTVLQRVQSGRNKPKMPIELSYIIVTAFVRRAEALVTTLAEKVTTLEQKVIGGKMGDPEEILEEMFRLRHELLTVRTLAAHSREGYARITSLAPRLIPLKTIIS